MVFSEYLHKYAFVYICIDGDKRYYLSAYVTSITETHITFFDVYCKVYTYRISDVVEIKASNRTPTPQQKKMQEQYKW